MTNNHAKMELLSPAGSEEAFIAALHNGADAIYLGAGPHHARQFAGGFSEASFFALTEQAHTAGVKVYLTLNTLLAQGELEPASEWAEKAWSGGVDAIIVQDSGLVRFLHQRFPEMILHASTQMSIHNAEGVLAAAEAGLSRVVLARELSLDAIAAIRSRTDIELEVFGHGALCVCYSGQCLMSSLIGGRSGNRGMCAQPCRLPWRLSGSGSTTGLASRDAGSMVTGANSVPVSGSASGTTSSTASGYLLSMKDLMSLPLLPRLQKAGISSLKLEGRMKSPEYVAIVTGIYRKYLDLLAKDGPEKYRVDPADERELRQIFNRGGFTRRYLTGMKHEGADPAETGSLVEPSHPKHLGVPVGTVLSYKIPYAEVLLTEDVSQGEGLEIHAGGKGGSHVVSTMLTAIMFKGRHEKQAISGSAVLLGDFKDPVSAGDIVYRTSQKTQMQAAAETVAHWQVKRVPLQMTFALAVGEPAVLTVEDDAGNRFTGISEMPVEAARERALAPERIREQLEKMGDAPWFLQKADIRTDGLGTMPVKEINSMRRRVLEQLTSRRSESGRHVLSTGAAAVSATKPARVPLSCGPERTMVAFASLPSPEWVRALNLEARSSDDIRLAIPPPSPAQLDALKAVFPGSVWIRIPSILPGERVERLLKRLEEIRASVGGFVVGNAGALRLLRQWAPELPIMADTGMNLWNAEAVRQAADWGADLALLSPELVPENLNAIRETPIPLASWAYGRVPVMTMEHCPGSLAGPCDLHCGTCDRKTGVLTDRAGASFPYVRDLFTEKTVVHHLRPLRWLEREQHPDAACRYLYVTEESPGTLASLLVAK